MTDEQHGQDIRPSALISFLRYNASAIIATGCDFGTLLLLTEVFKLWYVFSTACGALVGAIVAFWLGRNWAFVSKDAKKRVQALKYVLVAVGSLGLNTYGVYFFTDFLSIQYVISKIITAIIVGIGYNYTLSRYYIFK